MNRRSFFKVSAGATVAAASVACGEMPEAVNERPDFIVVDSEEDSRLSAGNDYDFVRSLDGDRWGCSDLKMRVEREAMVGLRAWRNTLYTSDGVARYVWYEPHKWARYRPSAYEITEGMAVVTDYGMTEYQDDWGAELKFSAALDPLNYVGAPRADG